MKNLKILFIMPNLRIGGAEKVVITIIQHLVERGWSIDLLLFKNEIDYDISALSKTHIYTILENKENISQHLIRFCYKFIKIIGNYDLLIGGLELFPSYLTILAGKLLRKKVILINHTFLSQYLKIQKLNMHMFLSKLLLPHCDLMICVSKELKKDLVKNFKIKSEKIEIIHNPINMSDIQYKAKATFDRDEQKIFNKPVIITAGSLLPLKGMDVLLGAFHLILKKGLDANLVIIGEGPEENNLKKLAQRADILNTVYFLGFRKNPYKYFANSAVFVLTSRVEGFSLVIAEALACGCPVISTNCLSGPVEILDGEKYGGLVNVDDVEELAEALAKLLSFKGEATKLNGFKRAKDFDVNKIIVDYEEIIKKTILM